MKKIEKNKSGAHQLIKKQIFFLMLFLSVLSFNGLAQVSSLDDASGLNLPPGSKMHPKFEFIDYSYKLVGIESAPTNGYVTKNFLEEFSEKDLENMKNDFPQKYQYYMTANSFYNELSPKVKRSLTVSELWYIYMYDVKLTNKLIAIK